MLVHRRASWVSVLLVLFALVFVGCGGGGSTGELASVTTGGNPSTGAVVANTTTPVNTGNPGTPANPANPTNPAPPAVVPPAPIVVPSTTADVDFFFLLARAIPGNIVTIEFTGFDTSNTVLFGPESHPRAAQITLTDVPIAVTRIRLRLYEGTTLHGEGNVQLSLTADTTEVVNDPDFTTVPQPTAVTVTPGSDTINVGQAVQLVATQGFTDNSVTDISNSATWGSSSNATATVSQTGLVQGVAAGTVTITAEGQGTDGTATINVIDPTAVTSISATPPTINLVNGTSGQITVQATLVNNSTINVTNSGNTQYVSSSNGIASVSPTGRVTANGVGSTQIQITHEGRADTVNVNVSAATLTSIDVTLNQNSITVGQSTTASVTGQFNNGTSANLTNSANYSVSPGSVATNSGRTINGVGVGTATVTANVNGVMDTVTLQVTAAPPSAGLARLNGIRAIGGLPAVTENATWSAQAVEHSRYMVKNDFIGHSQDPGNPWFTTGGNLAAQNGNLSITSNVNATIVNGIDQLMKAPFHGVGFIDPRLNESGFGQYCEAIGSFRCGSTVDVLRGRGSVPGSVTFPVTWPGDGQMMPYSAYGGGEFPDPLSGLPAGYATPTGAPIYVMFGSGGATINVTSVTLTNNTTSSAVQVGYFDETSYTNSNGSAQSLGRAVLGGRDCLVIMARNPLTAGHNYTCSVTNNGSTTTWSFTVSNPTFRAVTSDPVEITR